MSMVASGSVEDFGPERRASIAIAIAIVAGVDRYDVNVTVVGGSVRLLATIRVPPSQTLRQVFTSIQASMPDAEAASARLGVAITSAPTVRATTEDEARHAMAHENDTELALAPSSAAQSTPASEGTAARTTPIIAAACTAAALCSLFVSIAICYRRKLKGTSTRKLPAETKVEIGKLAAEAPMESGKLAADAPTVIAVDTISYC